MSRSERSLTLLWYDFRIRLSCWESLISCDLNERMAKSLQTDWRTHTLLYRCEDASNNAFILQFVQRRLSPLHFFRCFSTSTASPGPLLPPPPLYTTSSFALASLSSLPPAGNPPLGPLPLLLSTPLIFKLRNDDPSIRQICHHYKSLCPSVCRSFHPFHGCFWKIQSFLPHYFSLPKCLLLKGHYQIWHGISAPNSRQSGHYYLMFPVGTQTFPALSSKVWWGKKVTTT